METIKLSKNNFWIKISQWFISNYPTNTCGLRKTLIYGALMLLIFPLGVLALNIGSLVEEKNEEEVTFKFFLNFIVTLWLFTVIPFVMIFSYTNFTLNIWSFLIAYYVLGPLCMFVILTIIALIIAGIVSLIYKLSDTYDNPTIISELYKSAKEKYCKKIIIQ